MQRKIDGRLKFQTFVKMNKKEPIDPISKDIRGNRGGLDAIFPVRFSLGLYCILGVSFPCFFQHGGTVIGALQATNHTALTLIFKIFFLLG